MKKIYNIKNMSCASCALKIEKVLNSQNINSKVNYISEKLIVNQDEIDDEKVEKIVKNLGYGISKGNKIEITKEKSILPLTILFLLNFSFSMFMVKNTEKLQFLIATLSIILAKDLILDGLKSLINRTFNMNSLITLGVIFSYGYSTYNLIYFNDIYFEGVTSIIFIVKLGKKIENRLKKNTKDAIEGLDNMLPSFCYIKKKNEYVKISTEDLCVNDIVLLKEGNIVPADGIIIQGSAYFDEAFLTGEARLELKKINDKIYAGCILQKGNIVYSVKEIDENMAISKIKNILEMGEDIKLPIKRMTDKLTSYFVPLVITLSIFTFIYWAFIAKNIELAINNAICVLVIACPCSIGLAMPSSLTNAVGILAKRHILVKDINAIEKGYKINKIILDKTGTLTKGCATVIDNTCNDEIINEIYNVEKYIDHPISQTITKYIKENYNIKEEEIKNIRNFQGLGVSGNDIIIGNLELMKRKKIKIEDKLIFKYNELSKQGKTVILVAKYGEIVGFLSLFDDVKDEAFEFSRYCKKIGIELSILTGDNINTARYIANKLGINEVIAGVLPYEKSSYIEKELKKDRTICMIGDGINDAPALLVSDIGIAIGSGSDITLKTCDVIINSLNDIKKIIIISKLCMKNIKENLLFGSIYNIFGIIVAMGVLNIKLTPMLASIFMMLSSISVLLNSLKLKRSVLKYERKNSNY